MMAHPQAPSTHPMTPLDDSTPWLHCCLLPHLIFKALNFAQKSNIKVQRLSPHFSIPTIPRRLPLRQSTLSSELPEELVVCGQAKERTERKSECTTHYLPSANYSNIYWIRSFQTNQTQSNTDIFAIICHRGDAGSPRKNGLYQMITF